MAWETIENVKPSKAEVPAQGVLVSSRRAPSRRDGGEPSRYIVVRIGRKLAEQARFVQPLQQVRLMFGSGSDAGKIAVAMQTGGGFTARRAKSGDYTLTMTPASAEGLFSLEFPAFAVDRIEAIRPENGQPPMFAFRASAEMLKTDDD